MKIRDLINIVEAAQSRSLFYHATPEKNVASILESGLHPSEGTEENSYYGEEERTYFFDNLDECKEAVDTWLGDRYDYILSILEVNLDGIPLNHVYGEYYTTEHISPDRIRVVT